MASSVPLLKVQNASWAASIRFHSFSSIYSARLYLHEGAYNGEQILSKEWVKDSMDIREAYSKPGSNYDAYNAIGYGYQWWVLEGEEGEFMAIGVYGQWIYVNPSKKVIIVKTSADPDFMAKGYELKHVEFFRAVADSI